MPSDSKEAGRPVRTNPTGRLLVSRQTQVSNTEAGRVGVGAERLRTIACHDDSSAIHPHHHPLLLPSPPPSEPSSFRALLQALKLDKEPTRA
ncbi:hypothetical protein RM704_26245 [Streptomyces sp. DSM 3412]|uniref:Uncharacterized protein n=1 Tax=Streptomyces gottesmaniae TaxID=3075518 RepID=A0ABU2Z3Q8_9ACTN|nr:hypothetical protein [Streptomyces sp. DSM 3412]MDT0570919.1 hypothetical protein [Streptomyces sp. DSM 3412]